MGCVSSKVLRKSGSFREELSLSLQRRTNGMPTLENLLSNKNGGGEQLLALLCTANTVAAKLRAGNAVCEQGKPCSRPSEPEHDEEAKAATTAAPDEPASAETINAWELMADLEQEEHDEEEEQAEQEERERLQHLPQHPREKVTRTNEAGEGVARTRSFRTVEDFDAMRTGNSSPLVSREVSVESWLEECHGISSKEYPPTSGDRVQVVDACREQDSEEEEKTRDVNAHHAPAGSDGSDCSATMAKPELQDVDTTACSLSSSARGSASAEGDDTAGRRSFAAKKGLRRRAMVKELKALKVPSVPSFEFSSVGSLREWLGGGGQVFSPGSYVTPKFGNSGSQAGAAAGRGDGACEEAPFDPQLVADLEEAMDRMTMDEEHILRQIVESLQGSHEEDMKDK